MELNNDDPMGLKFEKLYDLWLSKKGLEHSKERFQEFCLFHNKELDKYKRGFDKYLKEKILSSN